MASTEVTTNGSSTDNYTPGKLTLYTNHYCPWAYRVHIALEELKIPFDEVIIDLGKPREEWYLKVNPRGQVPALRTEDNEILVESGVIAEYFANRDPTEQLLPASGTPGGALQRARINLFVDRFFKGFIPLMIAAVKAETEEEREEKSFEMVDALAKEVEPLLHDAAPFFGGSKDLTLAEVQTGSFVLRLMTWPKYEGLFSKKVPERIEKTMPNFYRWATAVQANKSVTALWNEKLVAARTQDRFRPSEKTKAAIKAAE
ncbi:MAG: hypothetical protein M4579_000774 [Chaenotheca gracillima]|nr:MAG: hypothetical protein M4579_000774 [Chaenotheca gracillima]